MSLTRLAIRLAAPTPRIEEYTRCLFIGPHPDDIEIGAGATAAKLAAMGKAVTFLICTDGRYGDGGTAARGEELIALRRSEAIKSAALLGVTDVRFLDFCDGGFYDELDLLSAMARVIGDVRPELVFAPDPNVGSECHPDHRSVGRAAQRLAYFCRYESIMARYGASPCNVRALAQYFTAKPNRFVGVRGFGKKQLAALFSSHISQFPEGDASGEGKAISLYLKIRALDFGIRSLKGQAEGFRVLGVTQMHCLPEADK